MWSTRRLYNFSSFCLVIGGRGLVGFGPQEMRVVGGGGLVGFGPQEMLEPLEYSLKSKKR